MSNQLHFEPTAFTNQRTGCMSLGCRIYDEYATIYTNTWDSIPDDDLEVIEKCTTDFSYVGPAFDNNALDDMIDNLKSMERGLFVGDVWYDWDKIKHLFAEIEK